jgi:hypothetical protein
VPTGPPTVALLRYVRRVLRALLVLALLSAAPAAAAPPRATVSTRGHVTYFRLSAASARQVAVVCERRGIVACGDLLTRGDGPQLAADCHRTGAALARQLRTAAGGGQSVILRTESGGYPYICAFETGAAGFDRCAQRRISQPELDAMPLFERIFALVRHGFCVGPGWTPDLPDS